MSGDMPYRDTPHQIATDAVAEVGWLWAVVHMARRLVRCRTWREAGQGVRLLAAVVFV